MATSGEKNQISALYGELSQFVISFNLTFFYSLLVTKDKRIDLSEKQTSRNVFFCRLIGPRNAGKSSFMRRFIGKTSATSAPHTSSDSIYNSYVINSIQVYGQKKYLIVSIEFFLYFKHFNTFSPSLDQGAGHPQRQHTAHWPWALLWRVLSHVWPVGLTVLWVRRTYLHCKNCLGKLKTFV